MNGYKSWQFIEFRQPGCLWPDGRGLATDLDRTPGYGLGYGWGTVGVRVGYTEIFSKTGSNRL